MGGWHALTLQFTFLWQPSLRTRLCLTGHFLPLTHFRSNHRLGIPKRNLHVCKNADIRQVKGAFASA